MKFAAIITLTSCIQAYVNENNTGRRDLLNGKNKLFDHLLYKRQNRRVGNKNNQGGNAQQRKQQNANGQQKQQQNANAQQKQQQNANGQQKQQQNANGQQKKQQNANGQQKQQQNAKVAAAAKGGDVETKFPSSLQDLGINNLTPLQPADFCSQFIGKQGVKAADGTQIRDSVTCSSNTLGLIPSADALVSSVFISPQNGETIDAQQDNLIALDATGIDGGFFSDPNLEYYLSPSTMNGNNVNGHVHVTVQRLQGDQVLDAENFDFFKGIDTPEEDNAERVLSTVMAANSLGENGEYRLCSITGSFTHQSMLSPVVQRGPVDDCIRFSVTNANGQAAAAKKEADLAAKNAQKNAGNNAQKNAGNNAQKNAGNNAQKNAGNNAQKNAGNNAQKNAGNNAQQKNAGNNAQQKNAGNNAQQKNAGNNAQKNTGNNAQKNAGINAQQKNAGNNAQKNAGNNAQQKNAGNNAQQKNAGNNAQKNAGNNAQQKNAGNNARKNAQ